ncbi:MAG: SAM-dependent methyltransferase [Candidatus Binataceae bacterium]
MATYEPKDNYYRKARERGLPSRAAFKIEEIISRARLVSPGARIIDLGAAPGGWLTILADAAGENGRVVGIDLVPCRNVPAGLATIIADVSEPEAADAALRKLGGAADLITSDLSPKLSGVKARDEARSRELALAALEFATRALRPGGAMVVKLFMSAEFPDTVESFRARFADVRVMRTAASRPGSSELYLVARDFHPGTTARTR